jgi:nitrite reductase (NADH) small subunit/3-phenylpropionate/trans-cinnamate dioxygenase ferredoxin subunit
MAYVKLARADEIPEGGMIMRQHAGREVLLAKLQGTIYAMDNICSHQGAELHDGELGAEGPTVVTCPWHAAHFDVRTGKVDPDTNWATDLASFPVTIEGQDVLVDL